MQEDEPSRETRIASAVSVTLFGPPGIERGDLNVMVDTRKAIALVALLAAADMPRSRPELAALLWPDADGASAGSSLRRTLSTLRGAIGPSAVVTAGQSLSLNREHVDVDVMRFRCLLKRAREQADGGAGPASEPLPFLLEAISIYRGDFLEGFSPRAGADFDSWQTAQSEAYRREVAWALRAAARALGAAGQLEPAITHARRLVDIDPLDESAHRLLMSTYAQAGDRAAAIRQYRECARILDEELAVQPVEETEALYESIRQGGGAPQATAAGGVHPLQVAEVHRLPLMGRDVEVNRLSEALDRARLAAQVVVVKGEAGIGKTRLLQELAERARIRGFVVLSARCYEGESDLAYAPLIQLLSTAIRLLRHPNASSSLSPHDLREVSRLVPVDEEQANSKTLPQGDRLERLAAETRFLDSVTAAILACAADNSLLLMLDDLHWVDSSTRDWLAYLLRRIDSQSLLVALAWREEEPATSEPLRQLTGSPRRLGRLHEIRLQRLAQDDVRQIVESVAPDNQAMADLPGRLFQESEGVPLFISEYLAELAEGDVAAAIPEGVRDVLISRVRRVSEGARQVLTTAAVIGHSFEFDTLHRAAGRDEEMTIRALEELLARGLVNRAPAGLDGGASYDFSHDKLRSVVLESASAPRLRLLHRRTAEALADVSSSEHLPASAGEIARHYREAGSEADAAVWHVRAGERAAGLFAAEDAIGHFRAALDLGHSEPGPLWESIGDLQLTLGEYQAAVSSYEKARGLSGGAGAWLESRLGTARDRWGDHDRAEQHFTRAVELGGDLDPADLAGIYSGWSMSIYHQRQAERALPPAQKALELAQAASDARAPALAHGTLGIIAAGVGDLTGAGRHLEASIDLARHLDDSVVRMRSLQNLALVRRRMGDGEAAWSLATEALELSASCGDRHREAAVHNLLADLAHDEGHVEEAMSHLKAAVSIYAEIGVESGELRPEVWKLTEW
ncbi:MAG TPA: AAA family ATPase [Chloroflexota bacterium]|nr:AAA family ATPase [Chloroflexota bacterium]